MSNRKSIVAFTFLAVLTVSIVLLSAPLQQAHSEATAVTSTRMGAWVDTIHVSANPSSWDAFNQLEAGTLDLYTINTGVSDLYFQAKNSAQVATFQSYGTYNELTLNPVGPTFTGTGKLNPFAVPKIRESLNWLIDRGLIVTQIYGDLGASRFFALGTARPDYVRHYDTIQALETTYAYNYQLANTTISNEMIGLGATRINNIWHYSGEPVTLIFLIRVEDSRLQIGDYVADQLESLGFVIDRQYVTAAQASPIWLGNPHDGLWHIFTGGWVATAISRDEGGNFQFFYTPDGLPFPLWQAYNPVPEFLEAATRLAEKDYGSMAARADLFDTALEHSMEDSVRIWLVEQGSYSMRRAATTAAYDLVGNFAGSDLWPYTIRFIGEEGGTLHMAHPFHLNDNTTIRATQDKGLVRDPINGLLLPQRIESAEVLAQQGLPIQQTHDWVSLDFSPSIIVPGDTWVDWNATDQVWITAAEKYTEPQTAQIRSIVQYPSDLFDTVTWHDGSPLSPADFVMAMIMRFDVANPASAIYDPSQVPIHNTFLSHFKGFRITSTNPLTIEYYTDRWELDAENNVNALWPAYTRSEGPWHTMAVGYLADANGSLAFTSAKSNAQSIPWMDFIGQPSLNILLGHLNTAQNITFVPYANTLSDFLTAAEVEDRWDNLQNWVAVHSHFWVGAGPFFLDTVSQTNNTLTLQRFPNFADPAGKWDAYNHDASPATVTINHTTGAPGSFFNITASNFPINRTASIRINGHLLATVFTGESGSFATTLQTTLDSGEGFYMVTVSVNPAAATLFQLDAAAPLREREGDFPLLLVPEGIAVTDFLYLPVVIRH
jgi:peptide/nickel transport system substrate-binding protein